MIKYDAPFDGARLKIKLKNLRGRRWRHNQGHSKIHSLGERAMAILKCWRLLQKLRCITARITAASRRRPRTHQLITERPPE
ncbi:hypothetical protein ACJ7VE_38475 [Streptomyces sp. PB17]|uniref:hypothetical protein n=1 Tax=Streptomyces sp. PB17 TaxID=3384158 RepID=UPI0038B5CB0A